jgi:aminopeptidase-like protein
MIGYEIHDFARQLWSLNRSITGEGVRETLLRISNHLPNMMVHSIP